MTRDELNKAYFEWMYSLVCDDEPSYRELFHFLHGVDFTYTIDMDGNRFDDGINLRYRFADESGYNGRMVAKYLDSCPCSVLEMLLALAIRLEVSNLITDMTLKGATEEELTRARVCR